MYNKCLFFLCSLFYLTGFSQSDREKGSFIFLAGSSVIDDSFTSDYNPFKISDRWNFGYYLGTEINLDKSFSLQFVYAENFYSKETIVNNQAIEDAYNYRSLAVNAYYNLNDALNLVKEFEPYLVAGLGRQSVQSEKNEFFNLGIGARYWFSPYRYGRSFHNFGLDFNVLGHWNLPQSSLDRFVQANLGIVYRLSK
jgi:hypothetical protein